jgi:hypothetical protein
MNRTSSQKPKEAPRLKLKDEAQHRLYGKLLQLPPGPHLQRLLESLRKK